MTMIKKLEYELSNFYNKNGNCVNIDIAKLYLSKALSIRNT